ncbi:MAG: hypothetical protein AAF494_11090 [Pseudomonadota bacterium]
MIDWLFETGHAAYIVLVVLVVLVLLGLNALWLRAKGLRWHPVLVFLGPAILIVLGLRAALIGAAWRWVAMPLELSLPEQGFDLKSRAAGRELEID